MATPSTRQLVEAVGISRSYAHEILKGRDPHAKLAAQIFAATGLKTGIFKSLSDEAASELARSQGEAA